MLELLQCGSSSEVAQATTLYAGMGAETRCASDATRCCRTADTIRLFDGDIGNKATPFIILIVI